MSVIWLIRVTIFAATYDTTHESDGLCVCVCMCACVRVRVCVYVYPTIQSDTRIEVDECIDNPCVCVCV